MSDRPSSPALNASPQRAPRLSAYNCSESGWIADFFAPTEEELAEASGWKPDRRPAASIEKALKRCFAQVPSKEITERGLKRWRESLRGRESARANGVRRTARGSTRTLS